MNLYSKIVTWIAITVILTALSGLYPKLFKRLKVWKRAFWLGLTEYIIAFVALMAWLAFEAGGRWFGWETYPVGYFQKVMFGILSMSIIMGVAWLWLGASFPGLKKELDPDQIDLIKLTAWEKLKLAFAFFALYAGGAVLLASLY